MLREFLLAIDDDNLDFVEPGAPVPPTFTTVFTFWGGSSLQAMLDQIGIKIWNVLHGEQEYEYLKPIYVGDTIAGQSVISNVYTRAGMNFVEISTDFKNQHGEVVVKDRALIIVKG